MKCKLSIQVFFSVTTIFLIGACSSATFIVKTDPIQADVFVENRLTGEKKPIGVTPLEIPISQVKTTVGEETMAGEFFTVVIEKKGFITQRLNVPATRFGSMITQIDTPLKAGDEPKQIQAANEILDHLYVAQKLALSKDYERAQAEIDKILAFSPGFARALSMRGSIYFVQKNYTEALKWFDEALKAEPKMEEPIKMIARIHTIQGSAKGADKAEDRAPRAPAEAGEVKK